jgi:tetratricopeptide (TPR) repeat protein
MKTSTIRRRSPFAIAVILWLLLCAVASAAPVRLPPVPENPELGWSRQSFFEALPPWNLDPLLFPPASRELPPRPAASPAETAWSLMSQADALRKEAESGGNDARRHDDSARLYLRAWSADKNGAVGYKALRMAARGYLLGGLYGEAAGVATTLIKRAGGRGADLPWYLLKGEALYRKRDLLAARECFRRAIDGPFDAQTKIAIALRIANASFELGNIAFAEPAFRKALGKRDEQLRRPEQAIRYGEALLAAGRTAEAGVVFGNLDSTEISAPMRAIARIGSGDAALLAGDLSGARNAYKHADSGGDFPESREWLKLRMADLSFAGGNRQAALKEYSSLASSPDRPVAREAGYKKALTMYLIGDHASVLKESEAWLLRNAGLGGEKEMRAIAAKAGASMVRAAGKSNPADRWPALAALLFSYGRTKEWPILLAEIGKEWEDARIWGGAADLYGSAGDAVRSADMRRIEKAEGAYYRGDLPGVLTALDWREPAKEHSPGALWLAAKSFFRLGRHAEAEAALRRLDAVRAESRAGKPDAPFTPERELAAYNRAQQESWHGILDALKEVPPQSQAPGAAMVKAAEASRKAASAAPAKGAPKAAAKTPSGGDIFLQYQGLRARVERIRAEDAP